MRSVIPRRASPIYSLRCLNSPVARTYASNSVFNFELTRLNNRRLSQTISAGPLRSAPSNVAPRSFRHVRQFSSSELPGKPGRPTSQLVVGVPKESFPGERRVALTPDAVLNLKKAGYSRVIVEAGAGTSASFVDDDYVAAGASIASLADVLAADVVLKVRYLE